MYTTTAAVYKREHKEYKSNYFLPIWLKQHYTQLDNYHLPKFEGGIGKKAKRKQSVALLLIENANYEQVFEVWFKLGTKYLAKVKQKFSKGIMSKLYQTFQ